MSPLRCQVVRGNLMVVVAAAEYSMVTTHRMVSCCEVPRRTTHREEDLIIHSPAHLEAETKMKH